MNIEITIDNATKSSLPTKTDIKRAILGVLKKEGFDIDCEIGIKIVSKDEIQKLNKKFRHLDKPTDVLSFPIYDKPPKKSDVPIVLGDIVICPEMADTSEKSLIIHGLRHLVGKHH